MKGTLIKRSKKHYDLYTDKGLYTSNYQWTKQGNLLSLKNCQAIEKGYDIDKCTVPSNEWEVEIFEELDKDGCLILKQN
jgi:hypothetical protein